MPSSRPHPSRAQRLLVYALFLLLAVVALWVPLYDRAEPTVLGIPFFYWFQILWIVAGALITGLAYRLGL